MNDTKTQEEICVANEQMDKNAQLRGEIRDWVGDIGTCDDNFQTTGYEYFDILGSIDEYLNKFRKEFLMTADSTIEDAETILLEELGDWLMTVLNESSDTVDEAMEITKAHEAGEKLDTDRYGCEEEEELLSVAEEELDEAELLYDKADKLLEQLRSLDNKEAGE